MPKFESILEGELAEFLELRISTTSKSCSDHDRQILKHFDEYLCSINCREKNLTESQMYGWIATIKGRTSTLASYVSTIRSFLHRLNGYGLHPFIPCAFKVPDDYSPYVFSDDELQKIFTIADRCNSCAPRKYPFINLELPIVLRLLYGCGLRLGEAIMLKVSNVDLDKGVLLLQKTKSNEQRIVPVHPSMKEILRRYHIAMGLVGKPDAFLFPGIDMFSPLTEMAVRYPFNNIMREAGISIPGRKSHQRGPCIHCFRHIFACRSFKQGEIAGWAANDQVPWLSIYLGHKGLMETQKYLKFSNEVFPEAMEMFNAYTNRIFPEVNFDE